MHKYVTIMAVAVIAVSIPVISMAYKKANVCKPDNSDQEESFLYL